MDRCIAHVDMDAFYVSVELRRRPELRGLPVIVAGDGPRSVVTTASYEARKFGVGSAIPASRARRLCPDGVYLRPDFPYYREASAEVMGLVRSAADAVEVIGLDEAYLDLSGMPAPRAQMRRLARTIEQRTGLGCSIGIGPSKLVAKVASDAEKPRGFVVLTAEQAASRFAPERCGLVPGIGPKTAERLRAAGLATLGELAAAPTERLRSIFGPRLGEELRRRARFQDDSPVTQERKVVSESRETTFDCRPGDDGGARAGAAHAWWRSSATASSVSAAAGARSGSRCGSTTSPPTPGRGRWPSRSGPPTGSDRWRWSCCASSRRRGRCGCWASAWRGCSSPATRSARS